MARTKHWNTYINIYTYIYLYLCIVDVLYPVKSSEIPPIPPSSEIPANASNDLDDSGNFNVQSRSNSLSKLILGFNDIQLEDIRSIGFGGMISLKLNRCNDHKLLKWLVDRFNSVSRVLYLDNHRFFTITADDVYDVFMVPRIGSPFLKYCRNEDGSEFCLNLAKKYQSKPSTSLSVLQNMLAEKFPEGGDDFKRLFVLHSMCSLLTPSSNRLITTDVLKSLENVKEISKLDWCSFILDNLCESVSNFKNNRSPKNIGGCILLLQIIYFHRLKWRGIVLPCQIPLIGVWSDKDVSKRCVEEAAANIYGFGELSDAFPLSLNGKLKDQPTKDQSDASNTNFGVQMDGYLQAVKGLLGNFQSEATELSNRYSAKSKDLNEQFCASTERVGSPNSTPEQTEHIFNDERLHKFVDDVYKVFQATKKLADEGPNFDILSPEPVHRDEAYFNFGDGHDFGVEEAEEVEEDLNVENEELDSAMHSVGSRGKTFGNDSCSKFWSIHSEIGYVSKYMIKHKKILSNMLQTHKEILDYCFYDAESGSMERYYRRGIYLYLEKTDLLSMLSNQQIYTSIITAWSHEINFDPKVNERRSRFIFHIDHSNSLRLHIEEGGDYELFVAECKTAWDDWLKSTSNTFSTADMLFIPFCLSNHYAAIAVDFIDSKIHYLDNRKYLDENDKAYFYTAAEILYKVVFCYLKEKDHPKSRNLSSFEFVNVPFKWQTTRADNDCGVYMMHHMKYFDGVVYTSPDLNNAHVRDVLRSEICATLILSNFNELRAQVVEKAHTFYQDKPSLLRLIAEKKKENTQRLKEQKKKQAAEQLKDLSEAKRGGKKIPLKLIAIFD